MEEIHAEVRLTSMTRVHCSRVNVSAGANGWSAPPALLTSASILPQRSATAAVIAATASLSVTSARNAKTRSGPCFSASAPATESAPSPLMSTIATAAPASASRAAYALPSPCAAPVTIATRLVSRSLTGVSPIDQAERRQVQSGLASAEQGPEFLGGRLPRGVVAEVAGGQGR